MGKLRLVRLPPTLGSDITMAQKDKSLHCVHWVNMLFE